MLIQVMFNKCVKTWNNRKNAIEFYEKLAINKIGKEKERILSIIKQLKEGATYCTDAVI